MASPLQDMRYRDIPIAEDINVHASFLEEPRRQAKRCTKTAYLAAPAVGLIVLAVVSTGGQDGRGLGSSKPMEYVSLAISGHLALATGQCANAASALLEVEELAEEEGFAGTKKLQKDIEKGDANIEVLHKIEQVMNSASLKDAMHMDRIITADDMNAIVNCELGRKHVHLEEHEKYNGTEIFEGDIMVEPASKRKLLMGSAAAGPVWAGDLWPDGKLIYCYAPDIKQDVKRAFEAGMEHVKQQVPCVQFVQIKAKDSSDCESHPSTMIQSSDRSICSSYIGKVNFGNVVRSQRLLIGRGCTSLGIVAHEIGHVLGLAHEHSRKDRVEHMAVVKENIKDGKYHNFRLRDSAYTGTTYDYLSLMHYSASSFGKDGKVTLMPHDEQVVRFLGQRMGFSELDIKHIGDMYGCKDKVTPLVHNEELSLHLAEVLKTEHAPFTKRECICSPKRTDQTPSCATIENGYCCEPESDAKKPQGASGAFCYTQGICFGEKWDHCVPRQRKAWYHQWAENVKGFIVVKAQWVKYKFKMMR